MNATKLKFHSFMVRFHAGVAQKHLEILANYGANELNMHTRYTLADQLAAEEDPQKREELKKRIGKIIQAIDNPGIEGREKKVPEFEKK